MRVQSHATCASVSPRINTRVRLPSSFCLTLRGDWQTGRVSRGATTPRPTPGVARNAQPVSLSWRPRRGPWNNAGTCFISASYSTDAARSGCFLEKRREYCPRIFYLHRLPPFRRYYVRSGDRHACLQYPLLHNAISFAKWYSTFNFLSRCYHGI